MEQKPEIKFSKNIKFYIIFFLKLLIMLNNIEKIQSNPIKSAVSLSVPIIILLILDAVYSISDTYWISGLGFSAIAALGYIANVVYASNKIGDGIGRAVNVIVSNELGAKNYEAANNIAVHGIILILIIGIITPPLSIPFIEMICELSGIGIHSGMIYSYLLMPISFVVFFMLSNYFAAVMGGEGDTKRSTAIIIAGNIINIVLDPIFIFNFDMGMFGAGLASTAGFLVSFLLFLYIFYYRQDTFIKIDLKHFDYDRSLFIEIIKLAIPIVLNGMILAFIGIIINYGLHHYASVYAVAAYVILLKIQSTAYSPMQGLSKGLCIVVGHLNGAKRFKVLKNTIKKIIIINFAYALILGMLLIVLNPYFLSIFTDDLSVMAEASGFMVLVLFSLITYSFILPCTYVFIGLEKSSYSFYFILLDIIVSASFMLLFSIIFDWGGFGVIFAVVLSETIQATMMMALMRYKINVKIQNDCVESIE